MQTHTAHAIEEQIYLLVSIVHDACDCIAGGPLLARTPPPSFHGRQGSAMKIRVRPTPMRALPSPSPSPSPVPAASQVVSHTALLTRKSSALKKAWFTRWKTPTEYWDSPEANTSTHSIDRTGAALTFFHSSSRSIHSLKIANSLHPTINPWMLLMGSIQQRSFPCVLRPNNP